jgi:hypothetical protein
MAQSNAFKFANNILTNGGYDAADLVGAAGGPTAGQVIQVLSATDSTQRSITGTSFVTGSNTLSVTITPASASNKIFIICSFELTTPTSNDNPNSTAFSTVYRGSSNVVASQLGQHNFQGGTNAVCITFLDSPNTTSATTYQLRAKNNDPNYDTLYLNGGAVTGSLTCFEIKG